MLVTVVSKANKTASKVTGKLGRGYKRKKKEKKKKKKKGSVSWTDVCLLLLRGLAGFCQTKQLLSI